MEKNDFVISLRDHLADLYQTKHYSTYGKGEFEAKKTEEAYSLVRKDPNQPKDLMGFCFRKDLCSLHPDTKKLYDDIRSFASRNNIESKLETKNKIDILTLKIDKEQYLVSAYVGPLYADNIDVYLFTLA